MATIETKYQIGDVVFCGTTERKTLQHPCPDCLGSRKWKVVSPAGGEHEFACPRCSARYHSNTDLRLDYQSAQPRVYKRTIGSVRYHSKGEWGDVGPSVEYMCHETGVGSGSCYKEAALHATEAEALALAQTEADAINADLHAPISQYSKTLELSDYQIGIAASHANSVLSREYCAKVERFGGKIQDALSELSAGDIDNEEFRDAVIHELSKLGVDVEAPA